MSLRSTIAFLLALSIASVAPPVFAESRPHAEFIYQWNEVLAIALRELNTFHEAPELRHITGDNPPRTARAIAMMHLALFEAVNGITGSFQPFTPLRRSASESISVEAAIREAARGVLEGLFGPDGTEFAGRTLAGFAGSADILRHEPVGHFMAAVWQSQDRFLHANFSREEITAGEVWGAEVAAYVLNFRKNDGSQVQAGYHYLLDDEGRPVEGAYVTDKYTPDADNPPSEPHWGSVLPFSVSDITFFTRQVAGPPRMDRHLDSEWMLDLHEVRILGNRNRYSPETWASGVVPDDLQHQHRTAFFWSQKGLAADGSKIGGFPTVTPVGQWLHAATLLAREQDLSIEQAARLFALLGVAGADAMTAAWKVKYDYQFWRPVQAMRWGNDPIDVGWIPLIPTSEHPEYVSGHATASGAAATILERFFGTDAMPITFFGDDALHGDDWRSYDSVWAAADEAAMSRLYGGIHYRFSTDDGLNLGRLIADHLYGNYFTVVR